MEKSADAFRTISEVAQDIELPQHVLRFWETRFTQIKPLKRGGGRRYYRPDDIELLKAIRILLYSEGYTIRGVQRLLKEQGAKAVAAIGRGQGAPVPSAAAFESDGEDGAEATFDAPETDAAIAESRDHLVAVLRMALAELAECSRVLDMARTQTSAG